MTFEEAERHRWNPFDLTKVWPQGEFPLIPVGRIVLNKNPTNYFAEVEQSAFAPAHVIPVCFEYSIAEIARPLKAG